MKRYKPLARWLYAEEPMWAFRSGIPLPPDLAVVVAKRFWSEEFTDARLVKDLQSYKPELILLKKDANPRPFQKSLDAEVRADLLGRRKPPLPAQVHRASAVAVKRTRACL